MWTVGCMAALLAGCGVPGAPLPPSLQLPRPVSDLAATRVADQVNISFHLPQENTDRLVMKNLGKVVLEECGSTGAASCTPLKAWDASSLKPGAVVSLTEPLPRDNHLAVLVENDRGRSAGRSNLVYVPHQPAWPNVKSVTAEATSDAVVLRISDPGVKPSPAAGVQYRFRIFRTGLGGTDPARSSGWPKQKRRLQIGEVPAAEDEFRDTHFEWQQRYNYEVRTINRVTAGDGEVIEFESGPAASASITTVDTFAPTAPIGLAAILNGEEAGRISIDLSWLPNGARDLAGYNVYRCAMLESRPANRPAACGKINPELVKSSAFTDRNGLQPGAAYIYTVTAVDLRGNESQRSTPATEHVPRQP
ncbi:MAG: fibronectin type III domain-containing protein [Acidobacteriaceae bacterium]